ncbi:MAG: adenylyl-sulfate kinase [Acidimicrobiia bacterium]
MRSRRAPSSTVPQPNVKEARMDTGFCLWFTGLSGAGKSTVAEVVVDELRRRGHRVELLDGDEVRENLSKGLGFSKEDRDTNIRRVGWVAAVLARNGVVAVTAAISPYREIRDEVRAQIDHFVEVFVDTPIEVCEERDTKGLYAKARTGEILQFTGVSDPYEPPLAPEVRVVTHDRAVAASAAQVLSYLEESGLTRPGPAPRPLAAPAQ